MASAVMTIGEYGKLTGGLDKTDEEYAQEKIAAFQAAGTAIANAALAPYLPIMQNPSQIEVWIRQDQTLVPHTAGNVFTFIETIIQLLNQFELSRQSTEEAVKTASKATEGHYVALGNLFVYIIHRIKEYCNALFYDNRDIFNKKFHKFVEIFKRITTTYPGLIPVIKADYDFMNQLYQYVTTSTASVAQPAAAPAASSGYGAAPSGYGASGYGASGYGAASSGYGAPYPDANMKYGGSRRINKKKTRQQRHKRKQQTRRR